MTAELFITALKRLYLYLPQSDSTFPTLLTAVRHLNIQGHAVRPVLRQHFFTYSCNPPLRLMDPEDILSTLAQR